MDNTNLEHNINDLVIDDQPDEREVNIKEYNGLYEDTQDFSKIIEEINNND